MNIQTDLGAYSRTSYDISWVSDRSRWPSRPIRSLPYIVTCTRIWGQISSNVQPLEVVDRGRDYLIFTCRFLFVR